MYAAPPKELISPTKVFLDAPSTEILPPPPPPPVTDKVNTPFAAAIDDELGSPTPPRPPFVKSCPSP